MILKKTFTIFFQEKFVSRSFKKFLPRISSEIPPSSFQKSCRDIKWNIFDEFYQTIFLALFIKASNDSSEIALAACLRILPGNIFRRSPKVYFRKFSMDSFKFFFQCSFRKTFMDPIRNLSKILHGFFGELLHRCPGCRE